MASRRATCFTVSAIVISDSPFLRTWVSWPVPCCSTGRPFLLRRRARSTHLAAGCDCETHHGCGFNAPWCPSPELNRRIGVSFRALLFLALPRRAWPGHANPGQAISASCAPCRSWTRTRYVCHHGPFPRLALPCRALPCRALPSQAVSASLRPGGLGGNRTRTPRFRCRAKRQKGANQLSRPCIYFRADSFPSHGLRLHVSSNAQTWSWQRIQLQFCSQAGKYQSALFPILLFT